MNDDHCVNLFGDGFECGADGLCFEQDRSTACFGEVEVPSTREPGKQHLYTEQVLDIATGDPLSAVTVTVCNILDSCAAPLHSGLRPDVAGALAFQVPDGFSGYLLLEADDRETYLPRLYSMLLGPVHDDITAGTPLQLFSADTVAYALAGVDESVQPDRSVLFLGALDCELNPLQGAVFESKPAHGGTLYYTEQYVPTRAAVATDIGGAASVPNVVPGRYSLSVRIKESEEFVSQVPTVPANVAGPSAPCRWAVDGRSACRV